MTEHQPVRQRLRKAWTPFFSRFGKLLPIQLKAIPLVLDGRNVVVCSPTASGKTEAVVAPTAERLCNEGWGPMSVVYVIPTRALANDTNVRIAGPLGDMRISTAVKHGDRPHFDAEHCPDWLITTPESLDSLLCRHSRSLSRVRTVILDELHLLDGTYRGDQLRVLLRRLRSLSDDKSFSTHVLSATLADPSHVAERYMDAFEVVSVPGNRELTFELIESAQDAYELARANGWRKVLYFCNARQTVEETARHIAGQWTPYPVVVHHGSLDRRLREEAEEVMKEGHVAACVCTSTLEVGVDIGDIDLVVIVELPFSLSALLQRLGRGNRRKGVIHAAVVANTEAEKSFATAMLSAAQEGIVPAVKYCPDVSVVVQQALSILFEHKGGITSSVLLELLSPLASPEVVQNILADLREKEWIIAERGKWYAMEKTMNLGDLGKIHSNIPDSRQYRVIDSSSGRAVGRVWGVLDMVFVLGHRAWKIESVRGDTIYARPFRGSAHPALFVPHADVGAFAHLLPQDARR